MGIDIDPIENIPTQPPFPATIPHTPIISISTQPETQLPQGSSPIPVPDVEAYHRTQYRIGKRDWKKVKKLAYKLNGLKEGIEFVNTFIEKKENPKFPRLNLKTVPYENLDSLYSLLKNNIFRIQRRNHIFITEPYPKPFFQSGNGKRPSSYVKSHGKTVSFFITSLILFFSPNPCFIQRNGIYCGLKHKTIFEVTEHHPEFSPNDIHVSHLCHNAQCIQKKHLVFESYTTNTHRNTCRIYCTCGAFPVCFTEVN